MTVCCLRLGLLRISHFRACEIPNLLHLSENRYGIDTRSPLLNSMIPSGHDDVITRK